LRLILFRSVERVVAAIELVLVRCGEEWRRVNDYGVFFVVWFRLGSHHERENKKTTPATMSF